MTHAAKPCIFHICLRAAAADAMEQGRYSAPSLEAEGFIHLSQAHQVGPVIERFYPDVQDLVLLVVDPARLSAPLIFEAASHPVGDTQRTAAPAQDLFPHLYGPLNADAVLGVLDARGFDGKPVFPGSRREAAPPD